MNAIHIKPDKVARIYRILLSTDNRERTWYEIAKEASVAYGWAHTVLKKLEKEEIIKRGKVLEPATLFQIWASRRDTRIYREYHLQNPEKTIKSSKMRYALTGSVAENSIGSYLFPRSHNIYILATDADKWNDIMTRRGYVGAGNVRIMIDDTHVFYQMKKIAGWPTVSPQQLIVDLIREGAECGEAAELLIKRYYR